ncbi:MAG: beta-lactamase family protein [Ruminococcaceae bacterium]|nr:beta-lactamase family protein [Oscillospiraceae bacterium]
MKCAKIYAKRLNTWLTEYEKNTSFSGSVQVISKGEVIFKKHIGYTDRERKIAIDDDTRFRFYSLTKPFVAIGIMKLYEEGMISLSAHPGEYIECARELDTRITIEMLLKHISGLPEIADADKLQKKEEFDLSAEVQKLSGIPLNFEPGTQVEYLNTNFIIPSLILEKFHKMPLCKYFEELLFPTLGMQTALCDTGESKIENLATGYEKSESGEIVPADYVNMKLMSGAGFAVGKLSDAVCLYDIIKNNKFLKPETWQKIFTVSDVGDFGAGCIVFEWNGKRTYQHNGGFLGFRTIHRYLPEADFDIIVLSNVGFVDGRIEICEKIHEIYFGESRNNNNPEMDKGFIPEKQ